MPYTYNPAIAAAGGAAAYRLKGAKAPTIRKCTEAASSTFRAGEIVKIVDDAVSDIVASGGVNTWAINATTTACVYGIAKKDATGTTGVIHDVIVLDDLVEYRTRVYHATAGSSEAQDVHTDDSITWGRYTGATTTDIWTMAVVTSTANLTNGYITEVLSKEIGTVGTYGAADAPTYAFGEQKAGDDFAVIWVRQATLLNIA